MRIAFLIRTLGDRAVSRLTVALATEMGTRGHDVTVVCLNRVPGAPDAIANADLACLHTGKRISPAAVTNLRSWARQWQPDLMFCQGPGPGRAALIARFSTRQPFSVAVVDHNPPSTRFSRLNAILRKADLLAAPTPSAAQRLSDRTGVKEVAVLPNPVIVDIEGSMEPPHPWYSEGGPLVCSVANIIPRKGQDVLIRALSVLEARLVLVGRFDDLGYLNRLQSLAHDVGVLDRVWFAGYQPDPCPFIYHSDAFALASRSESAPMVLAEAMACSVPVVATDCPNGPRELLDEGRAGVLVPVEDPIAMARALTHVLEDEATRDRLIQAGRRKAASLSVERIADDYLNVMESRARNKMKGARSRTSSTSGAAASNR